MAASSWADSEQGLSAYFVLFSALLMIVLVLSKVLHDRPQLARILPEAGMVLLVGILAGWFVNLVAMPSNKNNGSNSYNNSNNSNNPYDGDGSTQQPDTDNSEKQDDVVQSLLSFSPEVFFVALLPPIIFNSGYHLRRELFFRHITPICLLAVVGTTVSALCIAFVLQVATTAGWTTNDEQDFVPTWTELLTFGALLSATDPVSTLAVFQVKQVDPHLFYLVFGESVLNDAVGLVLFQAFAPFVERDNGAGKVVIGLSEFIVGFLLDSVGSPVLGIVCGCAAALLFKHVDLRETRLLELSLYVLIMYVPFMLAEILHLSGIVCILFSGMTARAYVVPNLSSVTAANAETLFRLAAHLAETSIFLELGLSVFGLRGNWHSIFLLWTLVACLIGRALNVYPIVWIFNQRLRDRPQDADDEDAARRLRRYTRLQHQQNAGSKHGKYPPHQHGAAVSSTPTGASIPTGIVTRTASPTTVAAAESESTPTIPRFRRDLRIPAKTAHMVWFSGLRGAVAYACVRSFPDTFGHARDFVMTTMAVVLVTVFLLGTTTEAMLKALKIDMNVDEDAYMHDWYRQRRPASLILRFEEYVAAFCVRDHHRHSPNVHLDQSLDSYSSNGGFAMNNQSANSHDRQPRPHSRRATTNATLLAGPEQDGINEAVAGASKHSNIELTVITVDGKASQSHPNRSLTAGTDDDVGVVHDSRIMEIDEDDDTTEDHDDDDLSGHPGAVAPSTAYVQIRNAQHALSPLSLSPKKEGSLFDFGGEQRSRRRLPQPGPC